jgi:hypothetical protein
MKDLYMAWTEWWLDLWVDHPVVFAVVAVVAIAITLFNNKMRRKR